MSTFHTGCRVFQGVAVGGRPKAGPLVILCLKYQRRVWNMHWDKTQCFPFMAGLWCRVQQAKSVVILRGSTTVNTIKATSKGPFWLDLKDEQVMPWFSNVEALHSLRKLLLSSTFSHKEIVSQTWSTWLRASSIWNIWGCFFWRPGWLFLAPLTF